MRVLFLGSGNRPDFIPASHQPFIVEQAESIRQLGVAERVDEFYVSGKGVYGYLSNLSEINRLVKDAQIDILHSHGGELGALGSMARVPKRVVTFHGSDLNRRKTRLISNLAHVSANASIVVSRHMLQYLKTGSSTARIIPCGVDLELFKPGSKVSARDELGLDQAESIVLFPSSPSNRVKRFHVAEEVISKTTHPIRLICLEGYGREQVATVLNAVDCLLVTSLSEGSPQVVKEALACNCPVVSLPVGDVADAIQGVSNCYVGSDTDTLATRLGEVLSRGHRSNGRDTIHKYELGSIAERVCEVYKSVLGK